MSYRTYDAAKVELLSQGFTSYLSPVNGAERFSKPSKVDAACGGYARTCIASIRHHYVAPQWGDNLDFFTIEYR